MNYTGNSMIPTFRVGDELNIIPYGERKVKIGDVVVFSFPGETEKIVHRVVSIGSTHIRTRGDNNTLLDEEKIEIESIIGHVASVKRGTKSVTIYNGMAGELYLFILKAIKCAYRVISILLHPIYNRLSKMTCLKTILPHRLRPRLLCFQRPQGLELQIRVGEKVIGRCDAKNKQWIIKKPFKLFVQTPSLPNSGKDISR